MKHALAFQIIIVPILCMAFNASAQVSTTDSAILSVSFRNAVQLYHNFLSPEKGLYNGRQYVEYASAIKDGNPYFQSNDFKEGSLVYDGVLFQNVPLLYDVVTDVVVVKNASQSYWLQLVNEKLESFSFLDRRFVRIMADSSHVVNAGFYELLSEGRVSLLKKKKKTVQEEILPDGVRKYVIENNSYYLKIKGNYYNVNSKSDVLKVLKERKIELSSFIKTNKINFRKAKDYALITTIEYYNTLDSPESIHQ